MTYLGYWMKIPSFSDATVSPPNDPGPSSTIIMKTSLFISPYQKSGISQLSKYYLYTIYNQGSLYSKQYIQSVFILYSTSCVSFYF